MISDAIVELLVDAPGNGKAQAKGKKHAGQANAQGGLPVLGEEADVDLFARQHSYNPGCGRRPSHLQGDQKKEDEKTQVGHIVEHGHGISREDGCDLGQPPATALNQGTVHTIFESRDAHHHRRTQQNAADDLGDDAWLVQQPEGICAAI